MINSDDRISLKISDLRILRRIADSLNAAITERTSVIGSARSVANSASSRFNDSISVVVNANHVLDQCSFIESNNTQARLALRRLITALDKAIDGYIGIEQDFSS